MPNRKRTGIGERGEAGNYRPAGGDFGRGDEIEVDVAPDGERPPVEFSRPEVADILIEAMSASEG